MKTLVPIVCVSVLFVIFGGVLFYMQTSSMFEIEALGIRGHSRLTPRSIVEHLDIPPHTNIFQVNLDDLQQQLESMIWIKSAEIYRNFPNKLSIHLTERKPFALVKLDELHLIDQEGIILGSLASGSAIRLPIITGSFVEQMRLDNENPQLQHAFYAIEELIRSSNPLFQHIRKIRIECLENVTLFSTNSSPEVRLSLVNYRQSLQQLERLYPDLQPETLTTIDLRFDKRVIVTPKNS